MPYRTISVPQRPVTPIIEVLGNTLDAYTLANNDIVNPVFICHRREFQVTDSDVIQIPALGAAPLATREGTYARTNQASPVQCLLIPGIGGWVAAPSQIQASINALGLAKDTSVNAPGYGPITTANPGLLGTAANQGTLITGQTNQNSAIPNNIAATGVPLLNLKSTTQIANALTITAGTTTNLTAITGINQPAYNMHITATAGGASTKPWYTVTLKWVDTASGFTIQVDSYTSFMSSTSNVLSMVIAGPTNADQLQVSVTNNDTVSMTVNTAFFVLSSRTNYTTDSAYNFWTTAGMPAIPTFQLGPAVPVPTEKILFSISRNVGIGATTSPLYALPVYSGPVFIHFDATGSNNWVVPFIEQTTGVTAAQVFLTGAPASANFMALFPRSPLGLQFTNNGSVLGTLNCMVVAQ